MRHEWGLGGIYSTKVTQDLDLGLTTITSKITQQEHA